MIAHRTRADRYAVLGVVLAALSVLAILTAYSFVILRWPYGLIGPGQFVFVGAFPVSVVGVLFSSLGRSSPSRRGIAVAGLVLSLAAALFILVICIMATVALSKGHLY